MAKSLVTLFTTALTVIVAVFVTFLSLSLTQAETLGHRLRPWLIKLAGLGIFLLVCLLISVGIEVRRWWRTRKLAPLLSFGEMLHEAGLRIPRDDRDRVLTFWREYQNWSHSVVKQLPEDNRFYFESLDHGLTPDPKAFTPLTEKQVLEVAGRVAVLRAIVKRLRGE